LFFLKGKFKAMKKVSRKVVVALENISRAFGADKPQTEKRTPRDFREPPFYFDPDYTREHLENERWWQENKGLFYAPARLSLPGWCYFVLLAICKCIRRCL
jgi:hypothetical protein